RNQQPPVAGERQRLDGAAVAAQPADLLAARQVPQDDVPVQPARREEPAVAREDDGPDRASRVRHFGSNRAHGQFPDLDALGFRRGWLLFAQPLGPERGRDHGGRPAREQRAARGKGGVPPVDRLAKRLTDGLARDEVYYPALFLTLILVQAPD